ncbi:MAG: EAL domain-containing response regulator [bacterium]
MTCKLLVVDDDEMIRQFLRTAAQGLGFEVSTASSAETFRTIFNEQQPDIVLLDLIMPGTDGVELLNYLAAMHCTVPVVLMSGLEGGAIRAAIRLGEAHGLRIVGGLEKPFDMSTLKETLGEFRQERMELSQSNLTEALENDEFRLHYQPQVHAESGQPRGFEALLRWEHPDYGLLLPAYFLSLAEESGFITSLTRWVVRQSAAQLVQWCPAELGLTMSINLSIHDLHSPNFPEWMDQAVRAEGASPHDFVLEVTEREASDDPERVLEVLTRLRLKGFQLSIDDFGTGYSSLSMVQRAPFNELKVDKSFVLESEHDSDADVIVRMVVNMGHTMGLRVVAEGVENERALRRMREVGVDIIQGYHTGRPMPASSCAQWLNMAFAGKQTARPAEQTARPAEQIARPAEQTA